MRRARSLLLWLALLVPAPSAGWENEKTHPRITDVAGSRFEDFDSILRDHYGLRDGLQTQLAVQTGFDDAIDGDLFDGAGPGSRYTRNQTWLTTRPWWPAPEDVGIRINHCEEGCASAGLVRADIGHLLRAGVYAEDNPNIRASHHFHDPENVHVPAGHDVPGDNRGLDNTDPTFLLGDAQEYFSVLVTACCRGGGAFRLFGRSAADRALDRNGEGALALNLWERPSVNALSHAEQYLYRAITAPDALEREHYMALHFLSVGAALHLLEDMSSVAHVRNDFLADHVLPEALFYVPGIGPSLEGAGKRDAILQLITGFGAGDLRPSLARNALHDAEPALASPYLTQLVLPEPTASPSMTADDFWGRANQEGQQKGIAQLVNQRFFSRATIHHPDYPSPSPPPSCLDDDLGEANAVGSGASRTWLASLPERDIDSLAIPEPEKRRNFFSSELVPHLASCRFFAEERPGTVKSRTGKPWMAHVIDESVQRDYLELLLPLTVDYTTKFLELYFEPRIAVSANGLSETSPPRPRLKIENLSRFPLTARADEVRVYYEDVEGGQSNFQLDCGMSTDHIFILEGRAAGQDPAALDCTIPLQLPDSADPPRSRGNFTVAIRGQLGERGAVVTPADDWRASDFVTMVDHVFGWQIAYQHSTGGDDDRDQVFEDEEIRTDVYVTGFDLEQAVAASDPAEIATETINVTAPLRVQLAQTLGALAARVDFSDASPEPNSGRLAFGGDATHNPPLENVNFVDPNEYYVAQGVRSTHFTALSMAGRHPIENFGGGPAWNQDPSVPTIVFSGRGNDGDIRIVQLGPSGQSTPIVSSETTIVSVSSAHGGRAVGARGNLTIGSDLLLVDAISGEVTDLIDIGSMAVESCVSNPDCNAVQGQIEQEPHFAPDGERIVFIGRVDPRLLGEIYIADLAASGRPVRRVEGEAPDEHPIGTSPTWSPDGEWIAFLGESGHINLISASGGRVIVLPFSGNGLAWLPSLLLPAE